MEDHDDLSLVVADLTCQWEETIQATERHAQALRSCGALAGSRDSASIPRLNAMAQDRLATLRSLQLRLQLVTQQLPSLEESKRCYTTLDEWKHQYQTLQSSLRSANLQAKVNIQKAAKEEREQLLGGGQDSTSLRQNLQTQAGVTAASESITETLRRTRQMMVQELERGSNTLATLDESNLTMKKAESEYKGQRSLLMATRHLLTVMKRHDVLDRVILVVGFIFFCLVVSYVFHQRIGTFKMLRRVSQVGSPGTQNQPRVSTDIRIDLSQVKPDTKRLETMSISETPDTIDSTSVNIDESLHLGHDEL